MIAFDKLYHNIIRELEAGLPVHLTYHSVNHTKYVVTLASYIAEQEKVPEKDVLLIKTAALFHDIGFLITSKGHETASCTLAKKALPDYGYSKNQIHIICKMILATQIPQQAETLLEQVLADADLEYLGTDQFDITSAYLYEEMKFTNEALSEKDWLQIQISFLEQHQYYTNFCKQHRAVVKAKNLAGLRQKLVAIS